MITFSPLVEANIGPLIDLARMPTTAEMTPTDPKVCSKCGERKPITDFGKTERWFRSYCKRCHRAQSNAATARKVARTRKRCAHCGVVKPAAAFSPDRSTKDCLATYCRPCAAAKANQRYWRDPEAVRKQMRDRIARNPEKSRRLRRESYHRTKSSETKAKKAAYDREYRARNREMLRASKREYAQRVRLLRPVHPDTYERGFRKTLYGLTYEEYRAKLAAQGGACAICFQPEGRISRSGRPFALCVDHDHATERVRDLLCQSCNSALRKFQEDRRIMARALAYLAGPARMVSRMVPAALPAEPPNGKSREARDAHLRRKYGVTVEQYEAMWTRQGGLCAICERPETRRIRGGLCWLSVDHDHASRVVRGLLCHDCNVGLGHIEEQGCVLEGMIRYLTRHARVFPKLRAEAAAQFAREMNR